MLMLWIISLCWNFANLFWGPMLGWALARADFAPSIAVPLLLTNCLVPIGLHVLTMPEFK